MPNFSSQVKGSTAAAQVTAVAQRQSMAQELPYATGAAIKKKKRKENLPVLDILFYSFSPIACTKNKLIYHSQGSPKFAGYLTH